LLFDKKQREAPSFAVCRNFADCRKRSPPSMADAFFGGIHAALLCARWICGNRP
jgi:hypothetical protein